MSVLLLVLLVVGAGAWAVSAGHIPGPGTGTGTDTAPVGASSTAPLAAPALPAPLPDLALPAAPVTGSGDFCAAVRDAVTKQSAALNDPNADLPAMIAEAQATNAAVAPAELQADFGVFLEVSDQLAAMLTSGTPAGPESLSGLMSPRFSTAIEHITGYVKTRCGLQFDSLTPPGLGG